MLVQKYFPYISVEETLGSIRRESERDKNEDTRKIFSLYNSKFLTSVPHNFKHEVTYTKSSQGYEIL